MSANNQIIFDYHKKSLGIRAGRVCVFYKKMKRPLEITLISKPKALLGAKEGELVNLVTSQINGCRYGQSAHTMPGQIVCPVNSAFPRELARYICLLLTTAGPSLYI